MRSGRRLAAGLGIALAVAGCGRKPAPSRPVPEGPTPATASFAAAPHFAVKPVATRDGVATWYDVPDGSLPERRAWAGELTAASNTAPIGCYLRVTRLENGKAIIVRVTDTGNRRNTEVDLSKEAAHELGMVAKGEVRVRVEQLALENADDRKPTDAKNATPSNRLPGSAVDSQTERQAADAKASPAS